MSVTVAELDVRFGSQTRDAEAGFDRVEGRSKGFGSVIGGVAKAGAIAFAAIGAAGVTAGTLIAKAGISMNAELETAEMQFTTLLGSADRAKDHVASLFTFAAETPFETGPIIEASRMMQTFGGDALNTKDNLRLVGDAAAGTSQGIEEVGFWTGRAYSMIQSGKPFGEAAMRLQEMGVLSAAGRDEMEALQKSGADTATIWGVMTGELGKFGGAMEMQASSWKGITSTLADVAKMGAGEMVAPFFESLKGLGQEMIAFSNTPAWDAIISKGEMAFGFLGNIISELVSTFQTGGIGAVLSQMAAGIGNVLTMVPGLGGLGIAFKIIGQVFEAVRPLLPPLIDAFKQVFGAIAPLVPIIAEALAGALLLIIPMALELFNAFAPFIPIIITIAGELLRALMPAVLAILGAFRPLIPVLVEIVKSLLPPFVEILRALMPLIRALTPIIQLAAELLSGALGVALRIVTPLLMILLKVIEGVVKAISWVVDKIGDMARGLSKLKLPGWLTPGSWSPFEATLWGSADAMKELVRATPDELGFDIAGRATLATTGVTIPGPMPTASLAGGGKTVHIDVTVPVQGSVVTKTQLQEEIREGILETVGRSAADIWG